MMTTQAGTTTRALPTSPKVWKPEPWHEPPVPDHRVRTTAPVFRTMTPPTPGMPFGRA